MASLGGCDKQRDEEEEEEEERKENGAQDSKIQRGKANPRQQGKLGPHEK